MPRRRGANIGRRERNNSRRATSRANASEQQSQNRLALERERISATRANRRNENIANRLSIDLYKAAFEYNANIDYQNHRLIQIGSMDQVCACCQAFKFSNESAGICCANGKLRLPVLPQPPEPLLSLLSGYTAESNHFLKNIQLYNNAFQMTSFGATQIIRDRYMPTFKVNQEKSTYKQQIHNNDSDKENENDIEMECDSANSNAQTKMTLQIKGQIYHQAGSLLPLPDADHQFLQIYFIGNDEDEANRRCQISSSVRRDIIIRIQTMLHQNNELVKIFRTSMDRMPSDNHQIVFRPDKAPTTEHVGRFNAPTINDVAIIVVGEPHQQRDIILQRRNNTLVRVSETHRSYDSLQYPLMFPKGEDGYHLTIKMINPLNGK